MSIFLIMQINVIFFLAPLVKSVVDSYFGVCGWVCGICGYTIFNNV